jgi:hypothetical protein
LCKIADAAGLLPAKSEQSARGRAYFRLTLPPPHVTIISHIPCRDLSAIHERSTIMKKKQLLAVIFFDGENRNEINFYKEKRKEVERMIEEYKK